MITIKSYDGYVGDKITSTSYIKNIVDNKIIFADNSVLTVQELLSAKEKYNICEFNKSINDKTANNKIKKIISNK